MVLVLLATAMGFALATLGRHTSAALARRPRTRWSGNSARGLVLEIVDAPRPDQLMLSSHIGAWLAGEASFWDPRACVGSGNGFCDGSYTLGWGPAIAVLVTVTVALTVGAFTAFRRRDLI
ncbi:hypothetical protein ACFOOK_28455 [Micromonospora krabiensis]|uniref:hypothetical protein n=1 Tax=Micromonospora krabiensis TaxID=307121 RepID=UPI003616EAD5